MWIYFKLFGVKYLRSMRGLPFLCRRLFDVNYGIHNSDLV